MVISQKGRPGNFCVDFSGRGGGSTPVTPLNTGLTLTFAELTEVHVYEKEKRKYERRRVGRGHDDDMFVGERRTRTPAHCVCPTAYADAARGLCVTSANSATIDKS